MLDSINLSYKELHEITGKKRQSAQVRVLRQLGIESKVRPDGMPLVCRQHYLNMMGATNTSLLKYKNTEPNFDNFNA